MNKTDQTINTYLNELKSALQTADKATVQDALADAEEHLRTALHSELQAHEEAQPEEVLEKIIEEYGPPQEIAEAYLSWERTSQSPTLPVSKSGRGQDLPHSARPERKHPGFFGIFADPRAWGSLVYMLISLVTGTLYFSWTTAALATSLGVMILIIGIPVTILFLLSIRGLAFLEGRLVEALLGERMPRRPAFTDSNLGWWERLKQLLLGKSTWFSIIYLLLMEPLGIIYFTLVVTLLATSLAFLASPIIAYVFDQPMVAHIGGEYYLWNWLTPFLAVGGGLLLTITLHLARWIGSLHRRFAKALLVSD